MIKYLALKQKEFWGKLRPQKLKATLKTLLSSILGQLKYTETLDCIVMFWCNFMFAVIIAFRLLSV